MPVRTDMNKTEKLRIIPGIDAKRLNHHENVRRAALRERLSDSRQLDEILKILASLRKLNNEITRQSPSTFTREKAAKYNLLHSNAKIRMDKHMALLNKVLPDDKIVLTDDDDNTLPELKLTVVSKAEDIAV